MRARACIKCREYIVVHPGNPVNQQEIKIFEKKHLSHTIMTVDLNEIKGIYASYKNHAVENASPEVD